MKLNKFTMYSEEFGLLAPTEQKKPAWQGPVGSERPGNAQYIPTHRTGKQDEISKLPSPGNLAVPLLPVIM